MLTSSPFTSRLFRALLHILLIWIMALSMHGRMGLVVLTFITELLILFSSTLYSGWPLFWRSLIIVLILMLSTTSLKSIIPKPSSVILLCRIILLILSGAFALLRSLFHINVYIRLFSCASWAFENEVVDPINRICERPNVLKISIFPKSDRYLFDQHLNWFSIEVYTFSKFMSLTSAILKPTKSPFTFILVHGVSSKLLFPYLISNLSSLLAHAISSVLSAFSFRPDVSVSSW